MTSLVYIDSFYYKFQEMQNQMKMLNPKQNMPEMSEILTSWLGGGSSGSKNKAVKPKPPRRR